MATQSPAQNKIAFDISFSEPQAHYVDVKMNVSHITQSLLEVKMPVWAPGSYLIREFAKNIEDFKVVDAAGAPLAFTKTNKNTWQIQTAKNKNIQVSYRVYAFEISVRNSFVDNSHAFLSPTGIFMYIPGQVNQATQISIKPVPSWSKISTGLEPVPNKANTFHADNFDILFDSPIEIGNQEVFEFQAAGVKHEVAMYGGGNYDTERLKRDMAKIVATETSIFGSNPNKRYVFIVHNYNSAGGGLEHLNSTVLGMSRYNYADANTYNNFLALVAHEYFHLWNVKRLRPAALGPFDYDQENYTTNLWISEGFTAYYDNLSVRRAGLYSQKEYIDALTNEINTVANQPGDRIQPVSEASFDAWIKAYRPNENSRNMTISYYDKGAMIALILDLEILQASKGTKRLDDVMKTMYNEYAMKKNRGFSDSEFRTTVENILGRPLNEIYDNYINGTQKIDFERYLNYVGMKLVDELANKSDPYIGTSTIVKDGKIVITGIVRGSAAWTAGLNVNDELIGIDDNRITDIDKMIARKKIGQKISLLISRDGLLQTIELTLIRNPTLKYKIVPIDNATKIQLDLREKWLN